MRRNRFGASSWRSSKPRRSACHSAMPARVSTSGCRCRRRTSSASWWRSSKSPAATCPKRWATCPRCCATAYPLIMPFFGGESLDKRMKAVANERERIRARERDRLSKSEKVSLRQTPKQLVSKVVEDFNLSKWLAQEAAREKLTMAGYRGQAPYVTFLFARLVTPTVLFIGAVLYVFVISHMEKSLPVKIGICIAAAYLVLQAPMLFLKNAISKRQLSIKRAFPDALDLLLICIESGMSVEAAFRKVGGEIVTQSVALSEEFALTTAELSYLQDRKVAYENLAKRTGLDGVKSVCLSLYK